MLKRAVIEKLSLASRRKYAAGSLDGLTELRNSWSVAKGRGGGGEGLQKPGLWHERDGFSFGLRDIRRIVGHGMNTKRFFSLVPMVSLGCSLSKL